MLQNLDRVFGRNTHRELESSSYTTTLPDAPYGRYFVFNFDSYFERDTVSRRGGAAEMRIVETVVASDESDAGWQVSGYFAQLRDPLQVHDTTTLVEIVPEELLEGLREATHEAMSERLHSLAIEAGQEWLRLVDDGEYEKSWLAASPSLRDATSRGNWVWMLESLREPLGEVSARDVASVEVKTVLPDGSRGVFLVVEFDTSFKNGERAAEVVILCREADGVWKISGYVITGPLESREGF